MDQIPAWVGDFATIPVLAGFLWYISRKIADGAWVPRAHVDLLITANDKVVEAKDKTIASQDRQLEAFHEVSETFTRAFESLKEASERVEEVGDRDRK